MHDVDQAITVLDRMLMVVVFIAVIFIFIAFLNKSFVTTLATAGTALLSLSFVFSGTCQEILGSCIFLFVKHPYDIGDRVDISSDQFTVDHISLLYTVFRRVSGVNTGRLVQCPHIVLNSQYAIENVSRSKAMTEQLSIMIHFDTSFEDIQLLKNELLSFVTDKENSRDYQPDLNVDVLGTSDMSKLELRIEVRHKSNWANETVRAARRSKFMCALVAALRRVPINSPGGGGEALGSAANATYSVAIPPELAQQKAEDVANKKAAAKLSNTKKDQMSPTKGLSPVRSRNHNQAAVLGLSPTQENAVNDLTSRSAAYDPPRDEAWTSSRDDTSTLGERPSIDPQDQEDIRGLLRRQSTRGRRKANSSISRMQQPNVPTITEPQPPISSTPYARQAETSLDMGEYEQYRGQASRLGSPDMYATTSGHSTMPGRQPYSNMAPIQQHASAAAGRPVEMRQMARSPSNPYGGHSNSISRNPNSQSSRPNMYEEV